MIRHSKTWLALAGIAFGGWLIVSAMDRDRSTPVLTSELPKMVYVCRDSKELFVGPARTTPAAHPITGKNTLLPGWYCAKCDTWHAGPPSEAAIRAPGRVVCPETRTRLQHDGPMPKNAREI